VGGLDPDGLLREHAAAHAVPGAALGVLRDGVLTTAFAGLADVATGEPVTAGTRFAVGSLTKPMVATVVARLAGEGRLSLDDPVADRVPELRSSGWAARATIADLLANRSGLPLRYDLEFDFERFESDDDAALSRYVEHVAAAGRGPAGWSYSNAGWCLLGRMVESAAGSTWEDAMRGRLFEPAGMAETSFAPRDRRTSGYDVTAEGPVPVDAVGTRAFGPAGTAVLSTVSDLSRFAALHLEDGSLAPLRDAQAEVVIHGWLDAWCSGWARFDWDGGPVWGWDGVIGGERCVLRLVPDRRGAAVLLTNGTTGRALYRSLFAELMPALFGIRMPPLRLEPLAGAAGDLARFAGVYAWPDRRYEVSAGDGVLVVESETASVEALPLDGRAFLLDAADPDTPTMAFGAFDDAGRPAVLYRMLWGFPRVSA
jgi:CubicO group peptidase (beta-lactamase class C family)